MIKIETDNLPRCHADCEALRYQLSNTRQKRCPLRCELPVQDQGYEQPMQANSPAPGWELLTCATCARLSSRRSEELVPPTFSSSPPSPIHESSPITLSATTRKALCTASPPREL